jgi:hypothetical protein
MLAGKLFYHIISTEAYGALQGGNKQRYQQLEEGLRTTLTALADRLWALTPAQIDAIKARVRAKQLRRQQQQQQTTLGPEAPHSAAAAAAAGEKLQLLQQHARLAEPALPLQAQHDGGGTSGVDSVADTGADGAAGSVSALPLTGSSTSSNSGSRLVGHKRQHSSSNGSRWSDDVLWIVHHYCLFHTSWNSPRAPPYNGDLLDNIALELFGPDFKVRIAA